MNIYFGLLKTIFVSSPIQYISTTSYFILYTTSTLLKNKLIIAKIRDFIEVFMVCLQQILSEVLFSYWHLSMASDPEGGLDGKTRWFFIGISPSLFLWGGNGTSRMLEKKSILLLAPDFFHEFKIKRDASGKRKKEWRVCYILFAFSPACTKCKNSQSLVDSRRVKDKNT